jgi:uncharacterized membrane protein YagU involved in acid resistance
VSDDSDHASEIAHASLRGAIAAAAMTGMRAFTVDVGLVDQTPPQAIAKQRKARGLLRHIPHGRRRAAIELAHWTYGAVGGAAYAVLPQEIRRQPWSGPAYGLLVWVGFELCLAPVLGLKQAKKQRPVERAALAADHLLYGLVLSEIRARPQETGR